MRSMCPARSTLIRWLAVACALALLAGCDRNQNSPATEPPTGAPPSEAAPGAEEAPAGDPGAAVAAASSEVDAAEGAAEAAKPELELAGSPRVDLLTNRYRWHLYRDGLIIPFAAEGFRKYTQEYRRPFGPVVEHDGRRGRVLERRVATLRVPWEHDGAATARLWAHGLSSGQRFQININGRVTEILSAGGKDWEQLVFEIDEGILKPGENEISLHTRTSGRAGGQKSWGLLHALELVDGTVEAAASAPPLTPVVTREIGGTSHQALGGVPRMVMYVEIPETAWLRADLGAADEGAAFTARARTFDGDPQVLLERSGAAGAWRREHVDLSALAGRLVALELETTGEGAWGQPRIALQAAPVRPDPEPIANVILLVVDALRSDRLELYGDTRVATPRMTQAGDEAVVFLNNQGASPSSPPSHGSIQTGMIPRVHGVASDGAKLDPGTPMISTQVVDAGIAAGYYGNNPFGMGRLESPGNWTAFHQPNKEGKGIDCTVLIDEMLGFATEQRAADERFFISSLPYEPHTPYRYHEDISEKYWDGSWGPAGGQERGRVPAQRPGQRQGHAEQEPVEAIARAL